MILTVLYYILYFAGLPLILIYFWVRLRSEREFIQFFSALNTRDTEENIDNERKSSKRYRATKIIFLVILFAFLGSWHFIASEVAHLRMVRELKFGAGGVYNENPVVVSLGPTYDVKGVINTIKEKKERWLPKRVEEVVNLENLKRRKGRIAVYRTYDQRYVITFTYLLPYPVIKSYGFQYVETEGGRKLKIIKKDQKTVFYPLNPGRVDKTGKLLD
ncbi:MAG: hypothetical protein V5A79_00635 [Candidatus Bipolaricaulota bacterium]